MLLDLPSPASLPLLMRHSGTADLQRKKSENQYKSVDVGPNMSSEFGQTSSMFVTNGTVQTPVKLGEGGDRVFVVAKAWRLARGGEGSRAKAADTKARLRV